MSSVRVEPSAEWAERPGALGRLGRVRRLGSRIATMSLVELRKISHDRTELYLRAVQPVLWLVIFGEAFTKIHAIPSGGVPYLDYLAPGVMAQSALFVSIFYGIQIIWDRDAGILTKLMATPTPKAALVAGKTFAAGVRATSQVVVVLVTGALLGVDFDWNPLRILASVVVVVLASAFFASLSMTIAGLVLNRDRLMGIGQAITMPLFFASNALYPASILPGWIRWLTAVNPLSFEVSALRTLLLGQPGNLLLDVGALVVAAVAGIAAASALLGRLTR